MKIAYELVGGPYDGSRGVFADESMAPGAIQLPDRAAVIRERRKVSLLGGECDGERLFPSISYTRRELTYSTGQIVHYDFTPDPEESGERACL